MADYLDSKLLSQIDVRPSSEPIAVKKKVGRPRGTTKANLEIRCFQSDLRGAIYNLEMQEILVDLRHSAERMMLLVDDSLSCSERFDRAKMVLIDDIGFAEASFEKIAIALEAGPAVRKSRPPP